MKKSYKNVLYDMYYCWNLSFESKLNIINWQAVHLLYFPDLIHP